MSDNTPVIPVENRPAASGFSIAADPVPVVENAGTSEQSGFVHQQKQADKTREEDEAETGAPSGFFKNAAEDEQSGFSLGGIDSGGGGFDLGPAATMSSFGGKWWFVHPDAIMSDGATMHPKFAVALNKSLDRMIKRALNEKWEGIILQQGLIGRVAAPGPLNRALNRRIQFLANPPPEQEKYARRLIRAMGFDPDNAEVKRQLQTLRSHAMSPEEVLKAINAPTPTAGAPNVPGTGPATPGASPTGPAPTQP